TTSTPSHDHRPYTPLFRSKRVVMPKQTVKLLDHKPEPPAVEQAAAVPAEQPQAGVAPGTVGGTTGGVTGGVVGGTLGGTVGGTRSEEHTSELQSREDIVCR